MPMMRGAMPIFRGAMPIGARSYANGSGAMPICLKLHLKQLKIMQTYGSLLQVVINAAKYRDLLRESVRQAKKTTLKRRFLRGRRGAMPIHVSKIVSDLLSVLTPMAYAE